jgi:hypothetical protein
VADHRGVILLVLTAWLLVCAAVIGCCVAARRGDAALQQSGLAAQLAQTGERVHPAVVGLQADVAKRAA